MSWTAWSQASSPSMLPLRYTPRAHIELRGFDVPPIDLRPMQRRPSDAPGKHLCARLLIEPIPGPPYVCANSRHIQVLPGAHAGEPRLDCNSQAGIVGL